MKKSYLYKKVMVVDDCELDRFIFRKLIENNCFAEEIVAFSSAADAIAWLQSLMVTGGAFPPLILLDINMPDMDGFDLLDAYVQFPKEARNHTTLIMISSTRAEEDFERINACRDIDMFFHKPLSIRILDSIRKQVEEQMLEE